MMDEHGLTQENLAVLEQIPEQPPSAGQHEQGRAANQPGAGPGIAGLGHVLGGGGGYLLIFGGDFHRRRFCADLKLVLGIVQFVTFRGVDLLICVISKRQVLKNDHAVLIGLALGYHLSIFVFDAEGRALQRLVSALFHLEDSQRASLFFVDKPGLLVSRVGDFYTLAVLSQLEIVIFIIIGVTLRSFFFMEEIPAYRQVGKGVGFLCILQLAEQGVSFRVKRP